MNPYLIIFLLILVYFVTLTYFYVAGRRDRQDVSKARRQYLTLKQQVNPHFLFNSLNVLDGLVLKGEREEASRYIHQLSSIYRYMLKTETLQLISLKEELIHARTYADLLHVRFPDGFQTEFQIPYEDYDMQVVPCSVQLLIENAVKHNAVLASNPLIIKISSDGYSVYVTNNIIPKKSKSPSHGVGLDYIRRQYSDSCRREIEVRQTDSQFTVRLPLLTFNTAYIT